MKKLPLLPTLFGILAFAQVENGLGQGTFQPGTSLPPRGYVLPPPPAYRAPAVRARVEEDRPAAKPVRKEATTAKSTKSTASTSTKKKTPVVAKSTTKTPEKKSSSVAKNSAKTPEKKTTIAKTSPSKKSSDSPAVAVSSTKRKDSSPAPKLVAASKPSAGSLNASANPAASDLGESPRNLHAPAGSLTARIPAAEIYEPEAIQRATPSAVPPPLLTEATLERANLPNLNRPAKPTSGVVTSADQLPHTVLGSAAMMPLRLARETRPRSTSHEETAPGQPKGLSAADLAAAQMKLDALAAIAPRAAIVEPLPMVEFPPEADFEPRDLPEPGGAPVVAAATSVPAPAETSVPPGEAAPSKLLSAVTLEAPSLTLPPSSPPPPPAPRTVATVKPTLAAVKTATFRPSEAPNDPPIGRSEPPTERRTEAAVDYPAEATFSAPDTPPPAAPKPIVKISPGLGALSIDAERADSETAKNRVTFNGNVTMNCTRFTLKADKVIADMQGDDGSGSGVQKVLSEGHVIVNMNAPDGVGIGYIASGNRAIYDPAQETLLISGWPKIEEGNKALVATSAATEILIDTKTGRLTTTGSTKTLIK